jgi:hypothetical protein
MYLQQVFYGYFGVSGINGTRSMAVPHMEEILKDPYKVQNFIFHNLKNPSRSGMYGQTHAAGNRRLNRSIKPFSPGFD